MLDGLKPIVLDGATADWVVVAARTQDGLGSFLIRRPGRGDGWAAMTAVGTLDPTRRVARLALDATPAEPVGPPGDHTAIWRDLADGTAVALAAELIGVCDAALAMATAYAGTRVQFDVPLSSHQVIQHKLVDMLHRTEMARVGVHFAAWSADVGDGERGRSAAIAKAHGGRGRGGRHRREHPGARRRRVHVGRRPPPALQAGQAERPAGRRPQLAPPASGRRPAVDAALTPA